MKQPIKIKWSNLTPRQRNQALRILDDRLKLPKDNTQKLQTHNVYAMSFNIHTKTGTVVN